MTKSDLMQYRAIRREAVQLREQIERLEAVMTAPPVQQFTGMPSGGAREGSRTSSACSPTPSSPSNAPSTSSTPPSAA